VRFDTTGDELRIYGPDGRQFLTYQELAAERERMVQDRDALRERAERMAAQLRSMGIQPVE
jgi:hypothetical protein